MVLTSSVKVLFPVSQKLESYFTAFNHCFKVDLIVIHIFYFIPQPAPEKPRVEPKKFVKIGRPGYRVTKQRESDSGQQSLLFQIDYPGKCRYY